MNKRLKSLVVYGVVAVIVVLWWTYAFKQKTTLSNTPIAQDFSSKLYNNNLNSFPSPSSISLHREKLIQALGGDLLLMSKMIVEWDIDARILQDSGVKKIERLSSQDFVRSQSIIRLLTSSSPEQLAKLQENTRIKTLVDDIGKTLDLSNPFHRFLPQTYIAASFLLALSPLNQIVALPRFLREQEQLYPRKLTDQIHLDIDRYNSEKIFQAQPEIAFVAHYSHPATIQALTNQGITLYTMKTPVSLQDISTELIHIGNIINRPLEAELLKIFMDAALLALDNRLALLTALHTNQKASPRLLFLNFHHNFSIPTQKTLTGQLLKKLSSWDISLAYTDQNKQDNQWTMTIDKERIVNLNPDCLIIAAENPEALKSEIINDNAMKELSSVRNHQIWFVDESIQHSPSQYIVLAYYDLLQALMNLP